MEKIAHIDGIAMEDYMYYQYKDIQFELAYLSRIVKYLKPRIKNLKDKKEFYCKRIPPLLSYEVAVRLSE